jgi:hypothetical protein
MAFDVVLSNSFGFGGKIQRLAGVPPVCWLMLCWADGPSA